MIPHKLTLRNFMCYRDDVPPLFFDGLNIVCLSGENGAGKSALLDAITWALWGKARAKSDDDLIALGQDDMEVDFEFVLDGALRRVIRRRIRGKRGQTIIDFQVCEEGGAWRRIGGDSVRDTEAKITEALRMNYETFINSAFLLQGRADEFTNRKPTERKQVLADILGLEVYEDLEARAKQRRNSSDERLHNLDGLIADHDTQVARRPFLVDEVNGATIAVTKWDGEVSTQEAAAHDLRQSAARLHQLADERAKLEQQIQRHTVELGELQQEAARIETRVIEQEALVARRPEIEAGIGELQRLEARLEEFDRLREEAFSLYDVKKVHDQALEQIRVRLELEHEKLTELVAGLRTQAENRRALEVERERLEADMAEYSALHDQLLRLRDEQTGLEERHRMITSTQLRVATLREPLKNMRQALLATQSNKTQNIMRYERSAARLPQLERDAHTAQGQLAELQTLSEQLGSLQERLRTAEGDRGRLREQCATLEKQGKEIAEKLRLIGQDTGACPVCEQRLDPAGQQRLEQRYRHERDQLRADFKASREGADVAEKTVKEGEPEVRRLQDKLAARPALEQRRATLEAGLEQATTDAQLLREQQADLDAIDQQLAEEDYGHAERQLLRAAEAELAELGELGTVERALDTLRRDIQGVERKLQGERQLHQRQAAVEQQLRAATDATAQLPEVETRRSKLARELETEDYGHDERTASNTALAAINALGYTRVEHDGLKRELLEHQHWARDLLKLEQALENLQRDQAAYSRSLELAARRNADIEREHQTVATLDLELRSRRTVEYELEQTEQQLRTARFQQKLAQEELGRAKQDLARCDQVAELLAGYRAQHTTLAEQRSIYDELAQAFGKKGIQAMLIETAIPEIEHEANLLLGRMTDNQMHLSLETQRDSKKGDTIETLDIRIADGLGTRDYAMFSGGEAFRVNFAVRIALSKLLAHRADANLKTLVIDEGFGTQDAQGRDRIVEAINAVSEDFERIIVITHIQELKDLFPHQLEVSKTPEGSTWRLL